MLKMFSRVCQIKLRDQNYFKSLIVENQKESYEGSNEESLIEVLC